MTRPGNCPIANEPCQSLCADPCGSVQPKAHDPNSSLVRSRKGCGHGVLFTEYCRDCEIVGLQEQYRQAIRIVQRVRNRMRALGQPMAGETSLPKKGG